MQETHDPQGEWGQDWVSPSEALGRFELGDDLPRAALDDELRLRHGVKIGPYSLLLPDGVVSEVVKNASIYPVPKTSSWVKGLINLRGNLIPVFDLARYFDSSAGSPSLSTLIVIDKGENALALMVEGLPRVANVSQSVGHTSLPLPELLRTHLKGAYIENDDMWLELDVAAFFQGLSQDMVD